jgi:hypothetical protein
VRPRNPPNPPAFGLVYEGVIGVCRAISSLELSKTMLFISAILLLNNLSKTFFISGKGPLLYINVVAQIDKTLTHLRTLLSSFYLPTLRRGAGELGDGLSILLQLLQDYRGGKSSLSVYSERGKIPHFGVSSPVGRDYRHLPEAGIGSPLSPVLN